MCFSDEVTIHDLEAWDTASQAARDGSCWMELARDRERFKRRVEKTGQTISPCLTAQHRAKVLDRLLKYSDGKTSYGSHLFFMVLFYIVLFTFTSTHSSYCTVIITFSWF